jgi:glycosyltransferase involved in cell wall biosynthesis
MTSDSKVMDYETNAGHLNADRISIVTRTRDRPLLVSRAIESVIKQSYRDWHHIIVNDGGDRSILQQTIDRYAAQYENRLSLIHISTSNGMVNALNIGMKAAFSGYVVTHDDDDSWEPEFLEKSIRALKLRKAMIPNTRGIMCHSTLISEYIKGNAVLEKYRYSLNGWVKTVALTHLSATNFIPPISFLFEREVFSTIGVFRNLKYAEDWEFYIRFLSKYEIAVLPEHLANYHLRPKAVNAYGNTVAVGVDEHRSITTALKNDLIREDLASGKFGLGYLVALSNRGPLTGLLRHRLWGARKRILARWHMQALLRRIRSHLR